MMKRIFAATLLLFPMLANAAQFAPAGGGGSSTPATSTAVGGIKCGTGISCAGDGTATNAHKPGIDPRYFGAPVSGTLVSAQTALGLTTVAGLQAYTLPAGNPYAGVKPYAALNTGAWRHYANFGLMQGSANGSTVLNFAKTVTTAAASTSASQPLLVLASGQLGGIHPGQRVTPVGNTDFSGTNYVDPISPQGSDGNHNGFYLSTNTTTTPASGHQYQVADDLTALVNALAAGQTITAYGAYLPTAGVNVTAVSQSAGTVTLASGTIANASFGGATSTGSAYDGVEFVWNYTDAEAAAMSMDNLGLEAAVQYALANGGGAVTIPGGTLMLNQSFPLPVTSGTFGYSPNVASIDVRGSSVAGTVLQFTTDLGEGQFAVPCFLRLSLNSCGGNIRDLTVAGSNSHFQPGGGSMTQMGGVAIASGRHLDHMDINYFYCGVCETGNDETINMVTLSSNTHGIRFDFNDYVSNADNYRFTGVISQNEAMASFTVSPNMIVAGSHFTSFTHGSGPFGFYKETGGSQNQMLADDDLDTTQCEIMSIACRGEDTPWLQHVSVDENVRWQGIEPGAYVSNVAPPGGAGNISAVFDLQVIQHGYIRPFDSYNWHPGVAGLLNFNAEHGLLFEGDIQGVVNTAGSVGIFGPGMGQYPGWGVTLRDTVWEAHLSGATGLSSLNVHQMVCTNETSTGTVTGINNCAGNATDNPQGVLLSMGSANNNLTAIIIHRGDITSDVLQFSLPKTTPGSSAFANSLYPQSICTASGGGIQPGAGTTCPNGGAKVGQTLRMDGSFSWVHIAVPGW